MTPLLLLAGVFLALQLLVALVNLVAFPSLDRPEPDTAPPGDGVAAGLAHERSDASGAPVRVSLLIPARDEEINLRDTLPRMLDQPAAEVLVLDDASGDGTAALVAAWAAKEPRLRLLRGHPLPAGWNGKNWACHQLSESAAGDLLLFVDADVQLGPGALTAALALLERSGAGLLTLWPRQRNRGWSERLVVPQVDMVLLGALPHPLVRALPFPTLAAGNGQFMLWTRRAYRRSGGHAAVRGEVLEDVRLAQRAKAAGVPLALALGGSRVEVRMYRSWPELRDGFAKNILAASGSPLGLLALLLLNTLAYTAPWPLLLFDRRWLAVGLLGMALRALVATITRRSRWEALLQPLAPLALWPIALSALSRRGSYRWKGRVYP